jgi:hypothetical protein
MKPQFEVRVEIIEDQLYINADDLHSICVGSMSKENSAFDQALDALAAKLRELAEIAQLQAKN